MGRCIFQIFCVLIIQMCFLPLCTSTTKGSVPDCIPNITVPRNTVWKVHEMNELRINCTVDIKSHCWETHGVVDISWCRLDEKNECESLQDSQHNKTYFEKITESKRQLFLIFRNISKKDAGLYRCRINSPTPSVSHSITVNVTDYVPDNNTSLQDDISHENSANKTNLNGESNDGMEFYNYIYIGVGVLLIIVGVTVIWCRGQKKTIKEKIQETQSTATPVTDPGPPRYNPRAIPRIKTQTLPAQLSSFPPAIYDIPPVRGMSLRDRSSEGRHPVAHGPPGQSHTRGNVKTVQEENPLIYATLNHEELPPRPVRVAHVQIEASEYAAIKVT